MVRAWPSGLCVFGCSLLAAVCSVTSETVGQLKQPVVKFKTISEIKSLHCAGMLALIPQVALINYSVLVCGDKGVEWYARGRD